MYYRALQLIDIDILEWWTRAREGLYGTIVDRRLGMNVRRIGIIALTVAIAACAGTPGPGDSGYPYNVAGTYTGTIVVDGTPFRGLLDVEIGDRGAVQGNLRVTQPAAMVVRLTGTLVGNELSVEMNYDNNPATGCATGGTATGTLTIVEGGGELSGPVTIRECGQVLAASFQLTR